MPYLQNPHYQISHTICCYHNRQFLLPASQVGVLPLASKESALNPEEIKAQPGRTRLSHYIGCNGINNHAHLETLMLQNLCFTGISERQPDTVFQRACAAAAMHVRCPLCMVHVGAGGPAFVQQRGTDALQTTIPPWHAQLLACDGWMGQRKKASPMSDHSGREITKSGSIFPICSSVPLPQIALAINA